MKYEDVRSTITSGDVIAFTHMGWSSWSDIESQIVRMATRSEFSHVAIAWVVVERIFIIEAVVPEIRIFPLSNFKEFFILRTHIPMSIEAEEFALSRVGERYSKWEAIKGYFGRNKDDRYWQCAEFVSSVLHKDGIDLPGKDTPTDLVRGTMDVLGSNLELIINRG